MPYPYPKCRNAVAPACPPCSWARGFVMQVVGGECRWGSLLRWNGGWFVGISTGIVEWCLSIACFFASLFFLFLTLLFRLVCVVWIVCLTLGFCARDRLLESSHARVDVWVCYPLYIDIFARSSTSHFSIFPMDVYNPQPSISRIRHAICARLAASATRLKSFRNGEVSSWLEERCGACCAGGWGADVGPLEEVVEGPDGKDWKYVDEEVVRVGDVRGAFIFTFWGVGCRWMEKYIFLCCAWDEERGWLWRFWIGYKELSRFFGGRRNVYIGSIQVSVLCDLNDVTYDESKLVFSCTLHFALVFFVTPKMRIPRSN